VGRERERTPLVLRVAQPQFGKEPFERVIRTLPIDPSRLHSNGFDRRVGEERRQFRKTLSRRLEAALSDLDRTVRLTYLTAGNDCVPMDVETSDAVPDPFHHHHLRLRCKEADGRRTFRSEI